MKQRIKSVLKFLGITAAVVFILFGLVTWAVFERKNDWLLGQIRSYVDESQSGQLTIATIDLKLFRSFPNITIVLDSIIYYEHRDSVRDSREQPIFQAKQLFVALELLPLMQDELNISEISISHALVNITEYQDGNLNINLALARPGKAAPPDIAPAPAAPKPVVTNPSTVKPDTVTQAKPKPSEHKPEIKVDLELISLDDILLTWTKHNTRNPIVIKVKSADIDLSRNEAGVNAVLTSEHQIQKLYVNGVKLPPGDLSFRGNVRYEKEKKQLALQSGVIKYDAFAATVNGIYSLQKDQMIDLQVDASTNDLVLLSRLFKPEVIRQNPGLLKKGNIYLKGRVFGKLGNQPPQFNISFGVRKLDMHLPKKLGIFEDVGFDGRIASGSAADYSRAWLQIRNLRGKLPDGFLKGQLSVNNFVNPHLKYSLEAKLKVDGYDQVFQLSALKDLAGTISMKANFDGPFKSIGNHEMDSSRSSVISLDNLSFVVTRTNKLVSGLTGRIENRNNQATVQGLSFSYDKNDLLLNATIDNLYYSLFNREQVVNASGSIQSNQIYTRDFILDTLRGAKVQDRISNLRFDFSASTTSNKVNDTSAFPVMTFDIRNLSANFDELPNIKRLNTRGRFGQSADGPKLELHEFHIAFPHGTIDLAGDLLIQEKLAFNARLKLVKFPWAYVRDFADEIKLDVDPTRKNLPATEMDFVTADLDLSALVLPYPFDIHALEIRNSRVNYAFTDSKYISVEALNLSLDKLFFKHPENDGSLVGLISTKGKVEFKELKVPGLENFGARLAITGENDTLDIGFSSATQPAKSEKGRLLMDISKKEIEYQLQYTVEGASLQYFVDKFYKSNFMAGDINYKLDLRTKGSNWDGIKQNMTGDIEIQGDSLQLNGVDIDDVLKKFRKSQNFNLTDVGAVVIAGPLGLAVTKGTDFVSLATINLEKNHKTTIQTLLAKWKLSNAQLSTEDVAFATRENRIAFDGRMDLAHDSIPGFTIAVVDKNGCSLMDQKLYGKMGALKKGKLNITKTLLGSVINFANAIVGKDCKPVYTGMVKDPFSNP